MIDFNQIAEKWQKKWEAAKLFEVEVDPKKKKFYIAIVYPYMSGLLHLGHLFTYTAPEIVSRYKRMRGFNVLSKFAFHCTGTPIVAAAQKVEEKEIGQLDTLKRMGIADKDINHFSDPEYWCDYFPKETLKDVKAMGFAIDERYTFRTTYLDPPYNSMVTWQFNKLKEKGLVKKGKHPVIWCPKDNVPVGDHDRSEGEGETLKDFIWIKFRMTDSDLILLAGTTRPDALYGQSNMWVDPEGEYVVVDVDGERWVVGSGTVSKIENQFAQAKVIRDIKPEELIGKWVQGPLVDRELYVLPAWFIDSGVGSGIVYSALEDPVDLIQLQRIQADSKLIKRFHLDVEVVKKLFPISIIEIPGMGENLGQEIADEFGVKSPDDIALLEQAKGELNKRVFRKGVMKKNCGACAGKTVQAAQVWLKPHLVESKEGVMFYEMSGKVVCRCLTECVVKLVSDQWFIEYNDPAWKEKAHKCLDGMTLYPELVRKQFEYVLDWLHRWACTREFGLGTKLPWDDTWVIESLSDSTIQMAYCTVAKYLEHATEYGFSADTLNDSFWDYVFLGAGSEDSVEKSTGIPKKMLGLMRRDFLYWYPFDYRNSAKDLLQNHLAFCIFNHTALFPQKHWPKAYILNGRIMVDNEKMSKSKGNFFTMRELYLKHGPDLVRLGAANAGEGIDDANYDMQFLEAAEKKLNDLHDFVHSHYGKGRDTAMHIDKWFRSVIHEAIVAVSAALDWNLYKSAVQASFLDLPRHLKWYVKRTGGNPNKDLITLYVEVQLKLLTPFVPHFSEECWSMIKGNGFISSAAWPVADRNLIKLALTFGEDLIRDTVSDIREVLKLAKIRSPKKITLFVSAPWKYTLFLKIHKLFEKLQDVKKIMKEVMEDANLKKHGKEISRVLPKMIATRKVPRVGLSQKDEFTTLHEAKLFFQEEFGGRVEVKDAEGSKETKAGQANPGKPAILVE